MPLAAMQQPEAQPMRLKSFPDRATFCEAYGRADVVPVCQEVLADTETPACGAWSIESSALTVIAAVPP